MKSEKDRVKTKSLRSEEDIFGDTEKDLDEDAAFVSNMVIGDTLSYTAMVCTSQNVFCWGLIKEGEEKSGEREEYVCE